MLEQRVFTQEELDVKLGVVPEETGILFNPGDRVQVRHEDFSSRWRKPHLRTPGYIFGKVGVVERVCGYFSNPELLAFGGKNVKLPLYRVRFLQKTIWNLYHGNADDTIDVEVSQHWLTSASESIVNTDVPPHIHLHSSQQKHHHHHDDHPHEERILIEQKAVEEEGAETPFQYLGNKLVQLLIEKEVVSPQQITEYIEKMDRLEKIPDGALLVANAWEDEMFKKELLTNTSTAAAKLGIKMEPIVALENTDTLHNVVVCTLCSCYPKHLLGRPPDWYKSRSYRSRIVYEPRKVLEEFGCFIPPSVEVAVHDSTSELRYLVIPQRPKVGTEGWSVAELAKIVTRDSMVGTSTVKIPKGKL